MRYNEDMHVILLLIGGFLTLCAPRLAGQTTNLIYCGADAVHLISPGTGTTNWTWRAADSSEIPENVRPLFRSTDDCKPFGDYLLITSSSGGVALIQRTDKRCAFYTRAANAHSACLLPGMRIAVAASTGGDALLVFDRRTSGVDAPPLLSLPLKGAHGVIWDGQQEQCWALGSDELLKLDRDLEVQKRYDLPTPGGHDLSFSHNTNTLYVTSNEAVYQFNRLTEQFIPVPNLGALAKVKSVDQHPQTSEIVFHQAGPETWWSDTIRFLSPTNNLVLPGQRIYKVRWDTPAKTPETQVAEKLKARGAQVFWSRKHVTEVVANNLTITDDLIQHIAWLPYLTDLSLEQTTLTDTHLNHIGKLTRLEWLNLWQTDITDSGLAKLPALKNLQHLPIGGTKITNAGLAHLQGFTDLLYLGLRQTAITDTGVMDAIQTMDHLRALNLSETAITDQCIPALSKLTRLEKLWITDTGITDAGFARLRAELPDCLILR
jgi:hypothetical protein